MKFFRFYVVLSIALIALKTFSVVDWPWLWVLSPLWLALLPGTLAVLGVLLGAYVFICIVTLMAVFGSVER